MTEIDAQQLAKIVELALDEDLGSERSDPTSESIFDTDANGSGNIVARAPGVIAGWPVAQAVYAALSPQVELNPQVAEGSDVAGGDVLATVHGPTRALLAGERTMLNLLCRASGVATHTRQWVQALHGSKVTVLDTRKTSPGLRAIDKYAVRIAGGSNKRMGLYDVAMIKDNHKFAAGSITAAYRAIRAARPDIEIQVEVDTVAEAREAIDAGASFLLCDNMTPNELREVAAEVGDAAQLEATGRITLDRAGDYAASGVNYISTGALTHSSPILDIALDWHQLDN